MHAVLTNARYDGNDIDGVYEIVETTKDRVVVDHPEFGHLALPRRSVTITSHPKSAAEPVTLSFDQLIESIRKRFSILDKVADGVVAGSIRSLIVSGRPGIGKSHSLERKLEEAAVDGKVKYAQIRGVSSAVGLYMELYRNRMKGNVTLIDDTDSVFNDEEALAVLKAALDSGDNRIISWNKASNVLSNEGIPNIYKFSGTVVFITNLDIEAMADGNSRLAPHVDALCSRSLFVDLGVHSQQAVMARITDVCNTTDMLTGRGLDKEAVDIILRWLTENAANVRSLSLRTALQIASLMQTSPTEWREIAAVTLLRR